MNEFLLIFGMALVTFIIRYPVLAFLSKMNLPEKYLSGLKFVPPTVLTAIIIPQLLFDKDKLDISFQNPQLIAGVLAALIAWKSKNLLLTIVLGMGIYLGLRWILAI
ncbi:MAG: AzlD domain-containing protein [Chloroflexi bacterium]|nr:AzlD domain-containing protein [Chloroflexota bacterium]MBT3669810.1 AzlD domain-containing protein [Chloroflexota bacterium]MBT4003897.1 AzlD domain-containing protein [Chloroflexota bacterium]MBT4304711.1 AzlD domain-containing protein [Chloroflexota bacterium]MBT4534787.1 AzlD domain-containing protein [Chloroflexota bacterium]